MSNFGQDARSESSGGGGEWADATRRIMSHDSTHIPVTVTPQQTRNEGSYGKVDYVLVGNVTCNVLKVWRYAPTNKIMDYGEGFLAEPGNLERSVPRIESSIVFNFSQRTLRDGTMDK